MLPSIPDWAFYAAAIALAALAITLFTWNRLRPRTRPKPRCSKCNYDLDGHHLEDTPHFPITCPECGHHVRTSADLFIAPRMWIAPVAITLLLLSYPAARVPHVHDEGWWASIPLSARVLLVRAIGGARAPASLLSSVSHTVFTGSGKYHRDISPWQALQLLRADTTWMQPTLWLADVPVPLPTDFKKWQYPPERATTPAPLSPPKRDPRTWNSHYTYQFVDAPKLNTRAEGGRLIVTNLCVEVDAESLPVPWTIQLADRLDQIKTPLPSSESLDVLRAMRIEGFWFDDQYYGLTFQRSVDSGRTRAVAGLRVAILDGDMPIGEARWHTSLSGNNASGLPIPLAKPGSKSLRSFDFQFATDPRLAAWLADPDDRFTVRITTDPEMVLSDFDATHYLDVDITLPGSVLKRKPATPPAAAQP